MTSVPRYLVALPLLGMMALYSTSFEERFFSGDTSIHVGDVRINASGRLNIWPVIIESARESPILGKGLGSSQELIQAVMPVAGHPHNDYLRIGHDLGLIGLSFLCVALVTWLGSLFSHWRRAIEFDPQGGQVQLAGVLGLLGLMLVMFTDNAIIYPFIMGPLGILVGAGLGHSEVTAETGRLVTHRSLARMPTTSPVTT
jgi:O-antigen ligase